MPSMLLSWLKIEAEERDLENRRGQKRWGMDETAELTPSKVRKDLPGDLDSRTMCACVAMHIHV